MGTVCTGHPHGSVHLPCPPDCETLIRRMLVVDPAKRISIAQIRQHRWMQADPALPHTRPTSAALSYNSNLGDYDEQVLGIMQTLGVDRQRTVEVSAARLPLPPLPPILPGLFLGWGRGSCIRKSRQLLVELKWEHGLI